MVRKLALVVTGALLHAYPDLQLTATILTLTGSIALHLYAMPFVSVLEHRVTPAAS